MNQTVKVLLIDTYPNVAAEFHPTKNTVPLDGLTARNSRKVWWLGKDCQHEWESVVSSRTGSQSSGCPYCAGKRILEGFNDLKTLTPSVAAEWHPTKNDLAATQVGPGSKKKAWWLGKDCGHEWEAVIYSRAGKQRSQCPYCVGKLTMAGMNDLASAYPEIAKQWDTEKNSISASDIRPKSSKKCWWVCPKGHSYDSTPAHRVEGRGCPYCSGKRVIAGDNDLLYIAPHVAALWHPTKNEGLLPSEVIAGGRSRAWWQCEKGHEWNARIQDRVRGRECPVCAANCYVSKPEGEIAEFLRSFGLVVEQSNRKLLKGQELDIYVPAKKFAVEFNGLYWHSEAAGKDKYYHARKSAAAEGAGVQLVHVWEDDWLRNPGLVRRMLAHKLGVSGERRVFGRKTVVGSVSTQVARDFLVENHIQGFASGSLYSGLFDEGGVLVAVLVSRVEGEVVNIIRYATSVSVVGGFTKLLKHAQGVLSPEAFITFADRMVSDGGLYESHGFVADKVLPPDYMYVYGGVRCHKFGFRLKRFKNDPELLWEDGLPESQLAQLNGIPRIWDAGKTRYRLSV